MTDILKEKQYNDVYQVCHFSISNFLCQWQRQGTTDQGHVVLEAGSDLIQAQVDHTQPQWNTVELVAHVERAEADGARHRYVRRPKQRLCHVLTNSQPYTSKKQNTRLTALFPGLPGWAGTRKVKPIWILLKQTTVSGSGINWAVCKSASRSRQITTPALHHCFLQAGCPSCRPTNSVKALKANHTLVIESKQNICIVSHKEFISKTDITPAILSRASVTWMCNFIVRQRHRRCDCQVALCDFVA